MKKNIKVLGVILIGFNAIATLTIIASSCTLLKEMEGPVFQRVLILVLMVAFFAGMFFVGLLLYNKGNGESVTEAARRTVPMRSDEADEADAAALSEVQADPAAAGETSRTETAEEAGEKTAETEADRRLLYSFWTGLLPGEKAAGGDYISEPDEQDAPPEDFISIGTLLEGYGWRSYYYDRKWRRFVEDIYSVGAVDGTETRYKGRNTLSPSKLIELFTEAPQTNAHELLDKLYAILNEWID